MGRYASFIAACAIILAACASDPCGPPAGVADLSAGTAFELDVTGASNADCTLTVSRDSASITEQIGAPAPPVADAPPDAAKLYFARGCASDAGANVSVSPSQLASATRSSTRVCVSLDADAMLVLGFSKPVADCAVTISLTCGGVPLYDHVSEELCQIMC